MSSPQDTLIHNKCLQVCDFVFSGFFVDTRRSLSGCGTVNLHPYQFCQSRLTWNPVILKKRHWRTAQHRSKRALSSPSRRF